MSNSATAAHQSRDVERRRHDVVEPFPVEIEADQIYHLACPASPVHFAKQPISILETCYQGTRNALKAAKQWNAKFLLASTSEVYGNPEQCPQTEKYGILMIHPSGRVSR